MKQLEDYVRSGWNLQVTLTSSHKGIHYDAWAYEHPDPELLALEGRGDSMSAMLRDLQECEKELYPHLVNDENKIQSSSRTKKLPTIFRMRSKPEGIRTNG